MLNLWNSGFSTIDSIHIHNNMPGGNNTSTRPVSKPGQPNSVKTIQTLLAAKKKDTSNKEPRSKRTHSEVSNDSNTSHDLSGLINFQKDLDEIKISLRDVTTKDDLNEMTKDLVKTSLASLSPR